METMSFEVLAQPLQGYNLYMKPSVFIWNLEYLEPSEILVWFLDKKTDLN